MSNQQILIVFATKRGTTNDVAISIAHKLNMPVHLFDCKNKTLRCKSGNEFQLLHNKPNLDEYDLVIIGTPMYMGAPLRAVKQFCEHNKASLVSHDLVFFTCGVGTEQEDSQYLQAHIPQSLFEKSILYKHLGGEIREDKMNALERLAMKEYVKNNGPIKGIDHLAIDELCTALNRN
jgi:menaquinone-dependent protoporphyrinogen IX oxidase